MPNAWRSRWCSEHRRWSTRREAGRALDPRADYRLPVFSLTTELPFAGHPTLGTARAGLDAGGVPRTPGRVVQECGAGLVRLHPRWNQRTQ